MINLDDFLVLITRISFLLISALTLFDYLRYRNRTRLDIALMFGSLGMIFVVQVVTGVTGIQERWLTTIGAVALMAQPYLLLRLVEHFRRIPQMVEVAAIAGMVASAAILVAVPTPLPPPLTLLIVAYFAGVEGYAAQAFVRGSITTRGVTRRRLTLAALGSGFLAAAVLVAGINSVLPIIASVLSWVPQFLAVLAAVGYYFGFAPPRLLRRVWQHSELYSFVREAYAQPGEKNTTQSLELLCRAATQSVGGMASLAALWDDKAKQMKVEAHFGSEPVVKTLPLNEVALRQSWEERRPILAHNPVEWRGEGPPLLTNPFALAVFIVPIIAAERALGLLLVFLWRPPLFADDDLELLSLFSEQASLVLDYSSLLSALEQQVEERTKALQNSEARKTAILETALDCVITMDHQGKIVEFNPAAERTFGYQHSQVVGRPLAEVIIPPSLRQKHYQGLARYLATGEGPVLGKRIELTALHADGHEFPVELSITPIYTGGQPLFTGFVRDITERKQAEEALRKSENQLSLVYRHVSDIIFYLAVEPDEKFRFLSVNPAFSEATGLAESQAVGKLVQEVIPEPSLSTVVLPNYREAIRDKKTVQWEEVSVYPTGTKYGIVAVTPIFDANGQCTNLVGAVHDITDSRQAEEEIRRLNEELEQKVVERTAQLEAANKELEAFAYSVSHDLRAPLRSIDGFSQVVLEEYAPRLDEQGKDYLQRVRAGSQRMAQLIDDLLQLSRVTRSEMHREKVDLTAVAWSITQELQRAHPERKVEFVVAPEVVAEGDPRLLRVVLENFLNNAWKFTGQHPIARIEFGVMDGEDGKVYFVRDDGVGFDMAYADKLFGAFQRLHGSTEFSGTGIGLATVQRIIHRHGGRVWAEGEVGKGATFYFTLS